MTGRTVSHYHIEERLGQGGMGVVYKARDTKLDRTVALKFLSTSALPTDDDKARFFREAKAAAQLNHPNIATVYEIDETGDGQAFIAMEYVEGETLSEKIKRGPLKLKEAITIACQVAEGLQAAHERGIVHRDVKSSNVMLTERGQVKVMDFGLARMAGASVLTKEGAAVGTVSYMSPEQARGEAVDHRSDIWSLGVVLYEMIVGRLPFAGDYEQAVVYSILNEEPEPLTAIRTGVPMNLERVVMKCLSNAAGLRYQHVDEVAVDLKAIDLSSGGVSQVQTTAATVPEASRSNRWLKWAGFLLVVFVAGVTAGIIFWRSVQPASQTPVPQAVKELSLDLPAEAPLALIGSAPFRWGQTAVAISPDGTHLVYAAQRGGIIQLYQRRMDEREATPMPGTEEAYFPFFSPNGQWVGFFANGRLKKVSLRGGEPLTLCEIRNPYGGTWGPDDQIIFGDQEGSRLMRVPASGGTPQDLGSGGGLWPAMLPGGKVVLVYNYWAKSIDVVFLESGKRKRLVENVPAGVGSPRYVPSGHLIFAQQGQLMAAPFDLDRLEVTAPPTPVLEQVRTESWGAGQYMVSGEGTLIYASGGDAGVGQLVWVDHQGAEELLPFPPQFFGSFQLSPDGHRLAVSVFDDTWDVLIYDLERSTPESPYSTRLTLEGNNRDPLWTPDGERVVFRSDRHGPSNLYWKRVDGVGEAERLAPSEHDQWSGSWSPDGRFLLFAELSPTSSGDIWMLPIEGEHTPQLVVRTSYGDWQPTLSPDGRLLAYISDESGPYEVYVQSFPEDEGRRQVSSGGGQDPIWSPSGDELFYHYVRQMWRGYAARVEKEPALRVGTVREVYEGPYLDVDNYSWAIGPDGRILLVKSVEAETIRTQINVVVNWFDELKRLVPVRR